MEENVYYSSLFDIYGEMLTLSQQSYFKDYYFENLLLDEIALNYDVSKNAVSKQIKQAKKMLDYYEEKLSIYKKTNILKKTFENDEVTLNKILEIIS